MVYDCGPTATSAGTSSGLVFFPGGPYNKEEAAEWARMTGSSVQPLEAKMVYSFGPSAGVSSGLVFLPDSAAEASWREVEAPVTGYVVPTGAAKSEPEPEVEEAVEEVEEAVEEVPEPIEIEA